MGITNEQYKGMLLDQQADLNRILALEKESNDTKVQEEVESQLAKIHEKLKF